MNNRGHGRRKLTRSLGPGRPRRVSNPKRLRVIPLNGQQRVARTVGAAWLQRRNRLGQELANQLEQLLGGEWLAQEARAVGQCAHVLR